MITLFDYGAGNLRSVQNTLEAVGARYTVAQEASALQTAEKIILPGVGHFGQIMRALEERGATDVLRERIAAGTPYLGICVGMQALFAGSEEAPEADGLGVFPGMVRRFPALARVPHMGWNTLSMQGAPRLLAGLGAAPHVYFAHSYYAPVLDAAAAVCDYTVPYAAAIEQGSLFGVQFHPEKSGDLGLRVMRNFVEL